MMSESKGGGRVPPGRDSEQPEWAKGLRSLYDSVVEEDIPDAFKDLLSQLDEGNGGKDADT